jgi:hypothetical protein
MQLDYAKHRSQMIKWIKSQLIGPSDEENDILNQMKPVERYPTGLLYPIMLGSQGIDPAFENNPMFMENDLSDEESSSDQLNTAETSQKKYRYMPPSSAGFSFFIRGDNIEFQVQCFAVRYEKLKERNEYGRFVHEQWKRIQLTDQDGDIKNINIHQGNQRFMVLQDRAELHVLWRPFADGWIVTISLCNSKQITLNGEIKDYIQSQNEFALFEVGLVCTIDNGEVGGYPKVDPQLLSDEEQEIELQYRHRHIYAIGHGVAVDWSLKNGRVHEIRIEFMPTVEVPQVTADVGDSENQILQMSYLCGCADQIDIVSKKMNRFISDYEKWTKIRKKDLKDFSDLEKNAGKRIVQRMELAVSRMKSSVELLQKDIYIAKAFGLSNQAMLKQMTQNDLMTGKKRDVDTYQWRPFQLAFLLTAMASAVDEDRVDRDVVDLIWFPTGGGKTEAYLGLAAFVIAWRRLKHPDSGGGTTVIMRYTLRLLTSQQYQRAVIMICALELIRQKTPELGAEPISIGLWVGNALSPNSFEDALDLVIKASQGNTLPPPKLLLDKCPWCHQPFRSPDNYHSTGSAFYFMCTNPACEFGGMDTGKLPCNLVDESLYNEPPTFLVATVDKFARLAWEERTHVFFGKNKNRPPELIIQDELHLISGALGSIAGIYESALDTVLTQRGVRPKYVASTATIRMAEEQTQKLYGRSVAIFPPPGLDCDDSYFAKTIPLKIRPGRLYLGYLTPTLNRQQCMGPLVATLLAAPEIVFDKNQVDREMLLEAWWTLVVYHGSLHGVGNSHNLFNLDIRERFNILKEEAEEIHVSLLRNPENVTQLTSVSSAEENTHTFARLTLQRENELCLDAVLATNMISVGLDVSRLALMVINGQPLTTAEYIQTSSRVGRADVPGIIVANYYRDQARSLSHYENFRPYHESFYRFVEPTSITPFTFQARQRALHAALVIAVRHGCPNLLKNNKAGFFDPNIPQTSQVIEALKQRCARADEERTREIYGHIEQLVSKWKNEADRCHIIKRRLDYSAPQTVNNTDRLLHNHDDEIKGLWATLQSMRNVESTALLKQL